MTGKPLDHPRAKPIQMGTRPFEFPLEWPKLYTVREYERKARYELGVANNYEDAMALLNQHADTTDWEFCVYESWLPDAEIPNLVVEG